MRYHQVDRAIDTAFDRGVEQTLIKLESRIRHRIERTKNTKDLLWVLYIIDEIRKERGEVGQGRPDHGAAGLG